MICEKCGCWIPCYGIKTKNHGVVCGECWRKADGCL